MLKVAFLLLMNKDFNLMSKNNSAYETANAYFKFNIIIILKY